MTDLFGLFDQVRIINLVDRFDRRREMERQLGYKQAKYIQRIEAVDSLERVYGGKGGYREDNVDYEWYAGI